MSNRGVCCEEVLTASGDAATRAARVRATRVAAFILS